MINKPGFPFTEITNTPWGIRLWTPDSRYALMHDYKSGEEGWTMYSEEHPDSVTKLFTDLTTIAGWCYARNNDPKRLWEDLFSPFVE